MSAKCQKRTLKAGHEIAPDPKLKNWCGLRGRPLDQAGRVSGQQVSQDQSNNAHSESLGERHVKHRHNDQCQQRGKY